MNQKHTVFLALLILSALIIRVLWSFWFAAEYWGDGYHSIWIINQTHDLGHYFDYKDRHLVWLPAYRFLIWLEFNLFSPERLNNFITPFLLQLWYLVVAFKLVFQKVKVEKTLLNVAFVTLWPLPIIYGGLNMPEGLALGLITSMFYFAYDKTSLKSLALISLFSALTALTRHEATAFLGIYTIILFLVGDRTKSYSIVIGVVSGLLLLSIWNWLLSGEPLFWLISKFNASSSGASDFIEQEGLIPRVSEAIFGIILVFPWLVVLPFYIKKFQAIIFQSRDESLTPIYLSTSIFLIVFLVSSLFFFHGADPKYLVIAALPCTLWTIDFLKTQNKLINKLAVVVLITIVPLYLLLFHVRSFNLELERRLGQQLEEFLPEDVNGTLWCDFPTVLVYADWNPRQIISSDQINRELNNTDIELVDLLIDKNVEFIISADYDHSSVLQLFEEMLEGVPFQKNLLQFTPIVHFDTETGLEKNGLESVFPGLANISYQNNKALTVWLVQRK